MLKIIIPIYKAELSETEWISLKRCQKVLGRYDITIIKPKSLDLSSVFNQFDFGIETFDDYFFDGVSGYNALMLSVEFYKRFIDYEYVLIYQLDAYVFRDELKMWCEKGYDYIGAPWLRKQKYYNWYYALYWKVKQKLYAALKIRSFHDTFDKVGNGGLSLRKVNSHYQVVLQMQDKIKEYISKNANKRFNEDTFWALEVVKVFPDFKIPLWQEALEFAFDVQVAECFHYNQNRLPFGVHGWDIRLQYYQKYIEEL